MGPLETGVLFVKEGRQDQLWPAIVTAGYSELLAGASRFGVLGQRDDPRLVAAGEAAVFLSKLGMANVEARSLYLAGYLKEKLLAIPGLRMLTPAEPSLSAAVLKFRVDGKNTQQLGAELWARHRISGAVTASGPLEGIRWCPHVYNTRAELDRAVEGLRSLL
jgi:selenocysteine lyase/cysteine desulfurase